MTDPRDVPADETDTAEDPQDSTPLDLFKPVIDEPAADDAADEDDPESQEGPDLAELPDEVRDGDVGEMEPH